MRATRDIIFPNSRFALVLWVLVVTTGAGASASDRAPLDHAGMQPLELRQHDRCLVCDGELNADGLAFLFRGRRITLDSLHLATFLEDPAPYFSKLQPRGALFQEGGAGGGGHGWLILGVWVTLGLLGAAICTGVALRKGLPPLRWFVAGLVVHVIAVIFVLMRSAPRPVNLPPGLAKIPATAAPYRCAQCGGHNHPSATTCRDCSAEITPTADSEVERAGLRSRAVDR